MKLTTFTIVSTGLLSLLNAQPDIKIENGVISYHSTVLYDKTLKRDLSQNEEDTLNYLNNFRQKAGLNIFSSNNLLNDAAYNHAYYMKINNYVGHYESSSNSGFTGVYPWNRTAYAGYLNTKISENLSYGQDSYTGSIDGLFSAIYHRFGFLDFNIDEIGIGIVDNFYVYDMGNSVINGFCENPTTSYGGYKICKDSSIYVPLSVYQDIESKNSSYVLWPYSYETDVPPAFYEESPDPLPDYSVSGYPVSVNFNSYFYSNISLNSFKLYKTDENGDTLINNTRLLTKESDPNNELSDFEYALFPLERLEWNSIYKAVADFTVDGESKRYEWRFKTKALKYPWFDIGAGNYNFSIKTGVTYAIYMKPQSATDEIGNISYSYSSTLSIKQIDYFDNNTILVQVEGNLGNFITLNFSNRSVTLKISDSDNANPAMADNGFDENQTENIDISLVAGWNLIEGGFDLNNTNIKFMWKFSNGKWSFFSHDSSLLTLVSDKGYDIFDTSDQNEGVWVYSDSNISVTYVNHEDSSNTATFTGWNLIGTSSDLLPQNVTCQNGSVSYIWSYFNDSSDQKGWKIYLPNGNDTIFPDLNTIRAKSGFWVNCK